MELRIPTSITLSLGQILNKKMIEYMKRPLRIECELPTEKDLDWMETAVQRHTEGFVDWWEHNKDNISGREWMRLFITVWEAGRANKDR
jgi:hypothetical protein